MNRRGFLGWLLGAGASAVACKVQAATASDVKALASLKEPPLTCLDLRQGGWWIKQMKYDLNMSPLDVTDFGMDAHRRFVPGIADPELCVTFGGPATADLATYFNRLCNLGMFPDDVSWSGGYPMPDPRKPPNGLKELPRRR